MNSLFQGLPHSKYQKVKYWIDKVEAQKKRNRFSTVKKKSQILEHFYWLLVFIYYSVYDFFWYFLYTITFRTRKSLNVVKRKKTSTFLGDFEIGMDFKTSDIWPVKICQHLKKKFDFDQVTFKILDEKNIDEIYHCINNTWYETFGYLAVLVRFSGIKITRKRIKEKFKKGKWFGMYGMTSKLERTLISVGCLEETESPDTDKWKKGIRHCYLSYLVVDYPFQKLGLAKTWLYFSFIGAIRSGVNCYHLDVGTFQQKNSKPIYERLGFVEYEIRWVKYALLKSLQFMMCLSLDKLIKK